jgi:CDP-6-deoxy-D-xylo-4-hexulose-3-dehydrase
MNALRDIIETRLAEAPASPYAHPLGFTTWGADEILAALECLCNQQTTMWTKTEAFETRFAEYLGTDSAVMVNSGSSADLVMMLAARESGLLQPGDEILVPAVTWPTQAWAAILAGFSVKFVDVDPATLNVSVNALEAAITPKTKAISLVHLMGNPCAMDKILELANGRGILLFEDCCEALGASFDKRRVGSFGIASAFSFFASHHISTMEGGMVATSSPDFADACRLLRAHGWARDLKHRSKDVDVLGRYGFNEDPRYLFLGMGFNFRPTELNAAFGLLQIEKLDSLNAWRNLNANAVSDGFRVTNGHCVNGLMHTSYKSSPAWFALPFVLREGLPYTRKDVAEYLGQYGIDTRPIVGGNLTRHPAFWKYRNAREGSFPGANAVHERGFYIGLPPHKADMGAVIGALNSFDSNLRMSAA